MRIGQRIAERRKMLGISQEILGEKMGVSRQAISKWEADAAMPEIDKLIALSKLFGVTVGWLLGTEDVQVAGTDGITEEQMKTIEALICQYSQPQQDDAPKRDWKQTVLTVGALCMAAVSLIVSLVTLSRNQARFPDYDSQLNALSQENAIIQGKLGIVSDQLQQIAQAESLVSQYKFSAVAWKDYKGATVTLTAAPKTIRTDDRAYISVQLGGKEVVKQPCEKTATGYAVLVDLPAENGYAYYFQVVHADGTQEQQVLLPGDNTIVCLASGLQCCADLELDWGGWSCNWKKLDINNISLKLDAPALSAGDRPQWERADLILYHNGTEIGRYSCLKLVDRRLWGERDPYEVPDKTYMGMLDFDGGTGGIVFTLPKMEIGDTLEMRLEAELSNGLLAESEPLCWEATYGGVNKIG